MIFLDGVGIGEKDFEKNPFFKYGFKIFDELLGEVPHLNNTFINKNGVYCFPVDARFNIAGFPQSGTGQASIFCGINAPKFVGKHFGPFPYSTTIPIIAKKNILKHFKDKGKKIFFANAYPKVFFDYLKSGKTRLNVTSLICTTGGIKLNSLTDVRKANALTAEITNERWNRKLNYNLQVLKPESAGRRLLRIASRNHFTLYEFYLTDHLGHGRIKDEFDQIYKNLDKFLFTVLSEIDQSNTTIIICSDHGNIEDLSIKTHTLNPALTITAGRYAMELASSINNLADIKKSIIKYCK